MLFLFTVGKWDWYLFALVFLMVGGKRAWLDSFKFPEICFMSDLEWGSFFINVEISSVPQMSNKVEMLTMPFKPFLL